MAVVVTNSTLEPRSYSVGPIKIQLLNFSVASGDTTAVITADGLTSVGHISVSGLNLTAAPTFSGNQITLAFVDPAATRYGSIKVYGK